MDGTSSTHGREVLCRSYIESSPDDRIDLIPSHPSSRHFCSFLASRLLFFVLCLLVVSLQVITTYPSLYVPITTKLRAHSAMSSLLVERSLYVLFSVALVACRFSWIVKIYKVFITDCFRLVTLGKCCSGHYSKCKEAERDQVYVLKVLGAVFVLDFT